MSDWRDNLANRTDGEMPQTLSHYSKLVDAELEHIIPKNKKPTAVYAPVWDLLGRGGKRFRPALCLLSCEAVGGKKKTALPIAAAIEMFHTFTLIHDDIEDDSELRRGKPCLHKTYGTPIAINAGDGLFMLVWQAVLDAKIPHEKIIRAQRMLEAAFSRVLEGQGVELDWHARKEWNLVEKDYFEMVGGKTGALISVACEVGAFVGGGAGEQVRALKDFGMAVGIGFQIQDDILNLIGEEEKYKKEIGGDITEGKRTLMVLHTLQLSSADEKKQLIGLLDSGTRDKQKIAEAVQLIKKHGAIKYAWDKAKAMVERAKAGLQILPKNNATRDLLQISDFLINRDF